MPCVRCWKKLDDLQVAIFCPSCTQQPKCPVCKHLLTRDKIIPAKVCFGCSNKTFLDCVGCGSYVKKREEKPAYCCNKCGK